MQDPRIRFLALALGLSVLAGGCQYFQSNRAPDDNAITSAVDAKLYQDPALKTQDIHVLTQKGVVLLSGTVANDSQKSDAEQLASGVSGVKQVMNQLTVASPASASTPAETPAMESNAQQSSGREAQRPSRRRSRQAANETHAPPAAAGAGSATQANETQAQSAAPSAPPAPVSVTIPAGTVISIRTIDTIDSSKDHAGQEISASVAAPVAVDGQVVIPQNADARLRLVNVASAGHIKGQSEVQIQLVSVSTNGAAYPVETGVYDRKGASRGKRSAETIGGGAGLGALIGALVGHGKGAAIGAAIGAGAGTATEEATKAQQVVIPSETRINFTLSAPVTVTVQP